MGEDPAKQQRVPATASIGAIYTSPLAHLRGRLVFSVSSSEDRNTLLFLLSNFAFCFRISLEGLAQPSLHHSEVTGLLLLLLHGLKLPGIVCPHLDFGMGSSHIWPFYHLGGVSPAFQAGPNVFF